MVFVTFPYFQFAILPLFILHGVPVAQLTKLQKKEEESKKC